MTDKNYSLLNKSLSLYDGFLNWRINMNPYIFGLVKNDLKNYRGISFVKYYEEPNTLLIYNIEKHDGAMIFFKDYLFEVATFKDDKKITYDKYLLLSDAIEHMDKLNSN